LVTLSLACASGRALLGAHVFGGPLRVLLVNAEDATTEMTLRLRAATQHHGLTDADVPGLHVAGADRLGINLMRVTGGVPACDPAGWATLNGEIDRAEPDVVIIDPLMSLMGGTSPNDNAAAAVLMVALAAQRRLASWSRTTHPRGAIRHPPRARWAPRASSISRESRWGSSRSQTKTLRGLARRRGRLARCSASSARSRT
jgi:RecA-family ATPase